MADNFQDGSATWLAGDDLGGGIKIPRVKLAVGADGAASDISSSNPLPVSLSGDISSSNPLPVSLPNAMTSASGAVLVGNNRNKLRDDFAGPTLNTAVWELVQTGAGMTISFPGVTTGYLNINSGTNANSETIIRSVDAFLLPTRLGFMVSASQRIANCEFIIEYVQVEPLTGLPVSFAPANTYSGTVPNAAGIVFSGTSATVANVFSRGGGAPENLSPNATITTTVATGTGPNFISANALELQASGEHVALLSAAIDSTASASVPRRTTQAAPDPNSYYKIQIRLRNLATPPVSATDWRVHALRLFDFTRLTAEIIGGSGNASAASSVPVTVNGTATVSGTVTATVASATVAGGTVAEDAAAGTSPVLVGGVVRTATGPTTLVAGDVARKTITSGAAQLVKTGGLPETDWQYAASLTTTTAAAARAAGAAGIRNYVSSAQFSNSGASPVDVIILDGSTVLFQATVVAGGFIAPVFNTPLRGTAATALNVNLSATGTVRANVQGYQAP